MSIRKRKVEDVPFMNGNGESTPKRNTSDVSLSQPDIDEEVLFDSLPSTQESNFRSDGSLSWSGEYVCQKLEEFGLPEAANKFRGKKPNLLI
jgi:hypothetical protein